MYIWLATLAFALFLYLMAPRPQTENARATSLGNMNFPRATEGDGIPIIWGTVRLRSPNTLWYGHLVADPVTEDVQTGLFSSETVTTGYRYYIDIDLGLCLGPNVAFRRMWYGDKEIHTNYTICDFTEYTDAQTGIVPSNIVTLHAAENADGGNEHDGPGTALPWEVVTTPGMAVMTFYSGSFDQPQHPCLKSSVVTDAQIPGIGWELYYAIPFGETEQVITYPFPRYAGMAHVVMRGLYLGQGGQLEGMSFELQRLTDVVSPGHGVISRTSTYDPTTNPHPPDADANPVEILHDLFTGHWGTIGLSTDLIDYPSWQAAAETLFNERNGMSLKVESISTVKQVVEEVLRQADMVFYQDLESGKLKVKLLRQDYDVASLPVLDPSNVRAINNFAKTTWDTTYNQVRLQFESREKDYVNTVATAQDSANIIMQQRIRSIDVTFPGVKNAELASELATRQLNVYSVPLFRCELECTRLAGMALRPGDVFNLVWAPYGITRMTMRVDKIDLGELERGVVKITCVQDKFAANSMLFKPPVVTEWEPPALDAFPITVRSVFEAPTFFHQISGLDKELADGTTVGTVLCLARRPSAQSLSFHADASFDAFATTNYAILRSADYVASGRLAANYSADNGALDGFDQLIGITIDLFQNSMVSSALASYASRNDLTGGKNLIVIGDEILSFLSYTENPDGTYTLHGISRGFLDTARQSHTTGDYVMFVQGLTGLSDDLFDDTDIISVRLRDKTSFQVLAEEDALVDTVAMECRAQRPAPPVYLEVNGSRTPVDLTVMDTIHFTWRERNRLSTSLKWYDDVTQEAESGQWYELEYQLDGGAWQGPIQASGESGTPYSTFTGLPFASLLAVKVWSVRDGLRSRIPDQMTVPLGSVWDLVPVAKTKLSVTHATLDKKLLIGAQVGASLSALAQVSISNIDPRLTFGIRVGFQYQDWAAPSYWGSGWPPGTDFGATLKAKALSATAPDVYGCVSNGDIYKQAGSAGTMDPTGQTSAAWKAMAFATDGSAYAIAGTAIYKKAFNSNTFVNLNVESRNWSSITIAPNGNVYACVDGGGIYMQTGGTGAFVDLQQESRNWKGITAAPNGDVLVCGLASGSGIYKQTGGTGNFVALSGTARTWSCITSTPAGNFYAAVNGGGVYYSSDGGSTFNSLSQTARSWVSLYASINGNVYAVADSKIYVRVNGSGDFVDSGLGTRAWTAVTATPTLPGTYLEIFSGSAIGIVPTATWVNGSPGTNTLGFSSAVATGTGLSFEITGTSKNLPQHMMTSDLYVQVYAKANGCDEATAQTLVNALQITFTAQQYVAP